MSCPVGLQLHSSLFSRSFKRVSLMARTFHTFDAIVIGSAQENAGFFRELLNHSQNVMFIDVSQQEHFQQHADELLQEALRRNGAESPPKAGVFKGFMKHLRTVWQESEQKAEEGWRGIMHYRVSGDVNFESAHSVRLNGKLLHAKSIILQPGSEAVMPKEAAIRKAKAKWLNAESLVKLKSTPEGLCVAGETETARLLRELFKEAGLLQQTALEDCPVVIATEQRPTVRSLHAEKTRLELDENGIPRVDPASHKAFGANLFVLKSGANADSLRKLFPTLVPLLN